MITGGIIKANKDDYASKIINRDINNNTIKNSEEIKKEMHELAGRIIDNSNNKNNTYSTIYIGNNEYIDLLKPLVIKNGDLTANLTILKDGIRYIIRDKDENTEKGMVSFNYEAQTKDYEGLKSEYESLKKVYILLVSHNKNEEFNIEIEDIELRLRWLVAALEKDMFTIEARDISNIKYFIDDSVVKAVRNIIY